MSDADTSTEPGARDVPGLLRMITLAVLVASIVVGLPGSEAGLEGDLGTPPARVVSGMSLEAEGWDYLLAHAAEAPLTAHVSGRPPPVVVDPPRRTRAERTSTLRVQALEAVDVTLRHPEGTMDTLRLEDGETGAFLVRPFSPGWRSWHLTSTPDGGEPSATRWTALVRPARPIRVLSISGPPGPESRAAMRALEESGQVVDSWTHVGRGMWMGREQQDLPTDAEAYQSFDVVVLFPGVAVPPAAARALLAAVTELGKGLLLAGATGEAPEIQAVVAAVAGHGAWSEEASVRGDTLTWRIPPEVTPLPPLPLDTRMLVPTSRSADDAFANLPALGLGTLGRGRVGALALPDTWIWRMTAGATDGHRTFWRDQVAWLAQGFHEDTTLELLGSDVRRGEQVIVRRIDRASGPDESPTVHVRGPTTDQTLEAVVLPSAPTPTSKVSLAAFAPTDTGAYLFGANEEDLTALGPDDEPQLAVHVLSENDPLLDGEGRLARIALGSPGGSVVVAAADAFDGPDAMGPEWPWRAFVFLLLAVLLTGEWLRRRLTARP